MLITGWILSEAGSSSSYAFAFTTRFTRYGPMYRSVSLRARLRSPISLRCSVDRSTRSPIGEAHLASSHGLRISSAAAAAARCCRMRAAALSRQRAVASAAVGLSAAFR